MRTCLIAYRSLFMAADVCLCAVTDIIRRRIAATLGSIGEDMVKPNLLAELRGILREAIGEFLERQLFTEFLAQQVFVVDQIDGAVVIGSQGGITSEVVLC